MSFEVVWWMLWPSGIWYYIQCQHRRSHASITAEVATAKPTSTSAQQRNYTTSLGSLARPTVSLNVWPRFHNWQLSESQEQWMYTKQALGYQVYHKNWIYIYIIQINPISSFMFIVERLSKSPAFVTCQGWDGKFHQRLNKNRLRQNSTVVLCPPLSGGTFLSLTSTPCDSKWSNEWKLQFYHDPLKYPWNFIQPGNGNSLWERNASCCSCCMGKYQTLELLRLVGLQNGGVQHRQY